MAKSFSVGFFCHGCQGKGIIRWESYSGTSEQCLLVFQRTKIYLGTATFSPPFLLPALFHLEVCNKIHNLYNKKLGSSFGMMLHYIRCINLMFEPGKMFDTTTG